MAMYTSSQYAAWASVFSVLTFLLIVVSLEYPAWTTSLSSDSTSDLVTNLRRDVRVGLFEQCTCKRAQFSDESILLHLSRGALCITVLVTLAHVAGIVYVRSQRDYLYFMRAAYGSLSITVCSLMSVGFFIVYRINENNTSTFVMDYRYGAGFIEAIMTGNL